MKFDPREAWRITSSMVVACALGAGVLGALYVATDRYQKATALAIERGAIFQLLDLDTSATVIEVRQFLEPERDRVVYATGSLGAAAPGREIAFTLDGTPVPAGGVTSRRTPLGRLFVARRGAVPAGFVVEGSSRGYKNRIRFLVGVTPNFAIAGVRVLEHEEDPGLGAEIATPEFRGQFTGREAAGLEVTRDPMPEDWRAALRELRRTPPAAWRARHADLLERERTRPVYAVTGATISSRALTDGVRQTLEHFRRRWALIEPYVGGAS